MKKLIHILESKTALIISGVFLLMQLIPHLIEEFTGTAPAFMDALPIQPAWVTVFISGLPLVYSAVRKLIRNKGVSKISSALLISIAMIAAIFIGDLFAAAEVAFIMALGELLEELTTDRARKGLTKLMGLAPLKGRIVEDGRETMVGVEEIRVGNTVRVLPGETIPVDGVILSGETSVDQSVMTGESLPVDKAVGDEVYCGCINRFGAIDVRTTKVGEDSSLQRLIRMVQEAEDKQAPMQRIADRWASYLVPVALLIAIAAGLILQDVVVAVTVLVVFCPCALVLATPTAIMAAIGQATHHGVIIKSGEALEKMGKVDLVAFDKTGTLTHGQLSVSDVHVLASGLSQDELLALTAAAESRSEHPLGKAITARAREAGLSLAEPADFRMTAGRGVCAVVSGKTLVCGSEAFLAEEHVTLPADASAVLSRLRSEGKASVLVGVDGACAGVIALSDTLRADAKNVASALAADGVSTVLLTGDNRQTAAYFAEKAGIANVRAELLPEDKVTSIAALQQEGRTVCMIGDGVNDAPALKTADVGVAMGVMGSDIAVEAADIALMSDDVSRLPYLKRLANATARTIRIAITTSLVINFAAIILSLLSLLTPTTGALVHNAGSVLVVLFAARLYDRKFE